MTYAQPSARVPKTSAPIKQTNKLSPEARSYRAFYESHTVSVRLNPNTGEATVDIKDRPR